MEEMRSTTYSFFLEDDTEDEKTNALELASNMYSGLKTNMHHLFPRAKVEENHDKSSIHRYYYDSNGELLSVISMHHPDEKFKMYLLIETIYQNGLVTYRNSITERK